MTRSVLTLGTDFLADSLTLAALTFTIYSLIQPLLSARISSTQDAYRKFVVQRESVKTLRGLLYTTVYFFVLSAVSALDIVLNSVAQQVPFMLSVLPSLDFTIPILFVTGVVLEIIFIAWYGNRLSTALQLH